MVVVGLATGSAIALLFKAVEGDQLYDEAPLANNGVVDPEHIVAAPLAVKVGIGFTVIVTDAVFPQPFVVPVTVYVVVEVGLAVGVAEVVLLKPVAGDQL